MDLIEKFIVRRAFGAGVLGVFFGGFVLCAGGYALVQHPLARSWFQQQLFGVTAPMSASYALDSSTDPIVSIVAIADPAVVSIVVTQEVPNLELYYERISPFGGTFSGFSIPRYRQNGTREEEVAGGTGFFVSADGYLVTNNHVIDIEESSYTVYLNDGSSYDATLVAADALLDVALLKVDAPEVVFSSLAFGDSDAVLAGQTVIAIGNALGEYRNTVSVGVISGLSRSLFADTGDGDTELLQDILQTDAAINPGNSGGPLLNLAGEVIGVNVAASVGSAENIGFALPANAVQFAVESMKEYGRVLRPWLGVRYRMITPEVAEREGLAVEFGAFVQLASQGQSGVISGSPADKAGIQEGDIILRVDGDEVNDSHDLGYLLRLHAPGDEIVLDVLRDGEEFVYHVTLEERPLE